MDVGTAPEAAREAAPEAAIEAAPHDAPAAEACVPVDADLTTYPVPDASIGDSGVSLAACVACLRTNCHAQLEACNADCTCIDTIFECVVAGNLTIACASAAAGDPAVQALYFCGQACGSSCLPMATSPEGGAGDGPASDAAMDTGATDATGQ
jgi:hypothetical protein